MDTEACLRTPAVPDAGRPGRTDDRCLAHHGRPLGQSGGSIVNITTYSTFEPSLWFPASSVYRAGVSAFTKLYADRYGPANIRMNCLAPGFTDSLDVEKFADLTALKRIGKVEEQAKAAAFLLSDDSSYITGQTLIADGGLTRSI